MVEVQIPPSIARATDTMHQSTLLQRRYNQLHFMLPQQNVKINLPLITIIIGFKTGDKEGGDSCKPMEELELEVGG